MSITNNQLVHELMAITENAIVAAKKLKLLNTDELNYRKAEGEWSVLECVEHLNLYGNYYLPEIEKQLLSQPPVSDKTIFKTGIIGHYFANLMQVKNGKVKKMKSPADKNPLHAPLTVTTIDRFIKQLERLKSLLHQSMTVDLVKTKAAISLTRFIKLRLGDTLRFFVFHIERHVLQAERIAVEARNIHTENREIASMH